MKSMKCERCGATHACASVPVAKVEKFLDSVSTDCEEAISRLLVLKTRVAKRTIAETSILRELDEILMVIRR